MGDHDAGDPPLPDGVDDVVLGPGIQGAGGLVQNDDGGILGQDTGDLQSLALSAGQVLAVLRKFPLIAAGPQEDIVVDLGVPGRHDDLEIQDGGVPHADILRDGVLK